MQGTVPGYSRGEGISMWMEQPTPGVGGRHRATASYGVSSPDMSLSPRQVLAREAMDARNIYRQEGLYTPAIRKNLQEVIEQNKQRWGPVFEKK